MPEQDDTKPPDERKRTYPYEEDEKREELRVRLVDLAARLHDASSSPVKSHAYFLIEAAARALAPAPGVHTMPAVTDQRILDASRVLMGGQPGKEDTAARCRLVGEHIAATAARFGRDANGRAVAPKDPEIGANWLACQLIGVDGAFKKLSNETVGGAVVGYIQSGDPEIDRRVEAVFRLAVEASALDVPAAAAGDPSARKKARDRIRAALLAG